MHRLRQALPCSVVRKCPGKEYQASIGLKKYESKGLKGQQVDPARRVFRQGSWWVASPEGYPTGLSGEKVRWKPRQHHSLESGHGSTEEVVAPRHVHVPLAKNAEFAL